MNNVLRAGAVAAVAVAVLLVVLFWPGRGGRSDAAAHCVGATGSGGRVLHVVVRMASGTQLVELAGGRTIEPTYEQESWSDRSAHRMHVVVRERGRIVGELLVPDDPGRTLGEPDPAYGASWTGYRQALASGKAKLVGEGTIYGHRVRWLQFAYPGGAGTSSRVAVDRDTYCPVAFRRSVAGHPFADERVVLARIEPTSESDFRRRTPLPNPGHATTSSGSAPVALVKPWLSSGRAIRGLKLAGVGPLTVTSGKRRSSGVELDYGARNGASWIRIDELKNPPDRSEWRAVPNGFVELEGGRVPAQPGAPAEYWTGRLVVNGIYTRIETTLGRDAVVAAARALKPV